jgi:hypothetical protein
VKLPFNNCIAIGVNDRHQAADRFCAVFEAERGKEGEDYVEVKAGPFCLYFVEDGTKDIAFSVDAQDEPAAIEHLVANGFAVDQAITARVGETFVRDADGILVNVFPVVPIRD